MSLVLEVQVFKMPVSYKTTQKNKKLDEFVEEKEIEDEEEQS